MNSPITLTHELRCGDNEAAYYVTERAEIMRRGRKLALRLYTDRQDDGMHNASGVFIGGEPSEWAPVTDATDPGVAELIAEWTADGWTLVHRDGGSDV